MKIVAVSLIIFAYITLLTSASSKRLLIVATLYKRGFKGEEFVDFNLIVRTKVLRKYSECNV